MDGQDYLFDIEADEREHPTWPSATAGGWSRCAMPAMPPIPSDATVSLGYSVRDMPQR